MTTARLAPRWQPTPSRAVDRSAAVLAAAGLWLLLLVVGLALFFV